MNQERLALNIQVRYITIDVISSDMQKSIKKEGVTLANPPGAMWFGAYVNDQLVGVACAVVNHKTGATRFKSDFVDFSYRDNGVYDTMFKARMRWAVANGAKTITAFCGPMSLETYRRYGFIPVKRIGKTENIFVTRQI